MHNNHFILLTQNHKIYNKIYIKNIQIQKVILAV